jgi:hypothetical protein
MWRGSGWGQGIIGGISGNLSARFYPRKPGVRPKTDRPRGSILVRGRIGQTVLPDLGAQGLAGDA